MKQLQARSRSQLLIRLFQRYNKSVLGTLPLPMKLVNLLKDFTKIFTYENSKTVSPQICSTWFAGSGRLSHFETSNLFFRSPLYDKFLRQTKNTNHFLFNDPTLTIFLPQLPAISVRSCDVSRKDSEFVAVPCIVIIFEKRTKKAKAALLRFRETIKMSQVACRAKTTSCCLVRPLTNRMFGNDSLSSNFQEPIVAGERMDDEDQCDRIAIYHLSSKILPLTVDDTVRRFGGDSCENRDQTMSPPNTRRESPLVARTTISKNAKFVPGSQVTPQRKPFSDESLSVERLDRLLKIRRRRNKLRKYNHPDHSWCSDFEKENRLPRNIYLPEMNSDLLSDADPVAPSKFVLKPRPKRRVVLSHRYIKFKNDNSG